MWAISTRRPRPARARCCIWCGEGSRLGARGSGLRAQGLGAQPRNPLALFVVVSAFRRTPGPAEAGHYVNTTELRAGASPNAPVFYATWLAWNAAAAASDSTLHRPLRHPSVTSGPRSLEVVHPSVSARSRSRPVEHCVLSREQGRTARPTIHADKDGRHDGHDATRSAHPAGVHEATRRHDAGARLCASQRALGDRSGDSAGHALRQTATADRHAAPGRGVARCGRAGLREAGAAPADCRLEAGIRTGHQPDAPVCRAPRLAGGRARSWPCDLWPDPGGRRHRHRHEHAGGRARQARPRVRGRRKQLAQRARSDAAARAHAAGAAGLPGTLGGWHALDRRRVPDDASRRSAGGQCAVAGGRDRSGRGRVLFDGAASRPLPGRAGGPGPVRHHHQRRDSSRAVTRQREGVFAPVRRHRDRDRGCRGAHRGTAFRRCGDLRGRGRRRAASPHSPRDEVLLLPRRARQCRPPRGPASCPGQRADPGRELFPGTRTAWWDRFPRPAMPRSP